jgi:hypothetical protein
MARSRGGLRSGRFAFEVVGIGLVSLGKNRQRLLGL